MEKLTVTFNYNLPFENYLADSFVSRSVPFSVAHVSDGNGEKAKITAECEKDVFNDVLAEGMTIAYKTGRVRQTIEGRGVAYAAFCGVLVGQEFEAEKKSIKDKLPDTNDVNADGIFNFLLAETDYAWRALATLGGKLYAQCREKEDVYALIRYFLGGETLLQRALVVDKGIYYDDDNTDMPCFSAFGDESEDAAFNLMIKKPGEVIVPTPSRYSPDLIELIRKLGE